MQKVLTTTPERLKLVKHLISSCHGFKHFRGRSHETLRSAADAALTVLKDENMPDKEKKTEIEDILGTKISGDKFSELLKLSKRITDYIDAEEEAGLEELRINEETGVAVNFEGSDDDDDIPIDSDDDEESEEEVIQGPNNEDANDMNEETEVIGNRKNSTQRRHYTST